MRVTKNLEDRRRILDKIRYKLSKQVGLKKDINYFKQLDDLERIISQKDSFDDLLESYFPRRIWDKRAPFLLFDFLNVEDNRIVDINGTPVETITKDERFKSIGLLIKSPYESSQNGSKGSFQSWSLVENAFYNKHRGGNMKGSQFDDREESYELEILTFIEGSGIFKKNRGKNTEECGYI